MSSVFASFSRKRLAQPGLALGLFSLMLLAAAALNASAQFGAPPTTKVNDPAALKPPPGSHVAIVEFEDLECPDCARANPLLMEAADKYKIPWVRHDFPLPFHAWSFQAAVNARFFDTKNKRMGDDYRNFIFASQPQIETLQDLTKFTQQFADVHKVALPFAVDPMGRLAAEVKADYALGQRVGIEHTPTIWVVTDGSHGAPFVEVVDRTKLFQLIDAALAAAGH
jgi:protein-disulfide isomerase